MKTLSRTLFAAYLLILLWLVLFEFSYDPLAVIREFQMRRLNLVPFAWVYKFEVVSNIVALIPFGVLLGVNFKTVTFARRAGLIFAFSVAVEILQFALAIGVTDITDVITNTFGGFLGLTAYAAATKYANDKNLDLFIVVSGTSILLIILYLRIFVFIVRY